MQKRVFVNLWAIKYHLEKCFGLETSTEEIFEVFGIANLVGGTIVIPHTRRAVEYREALMSGEGVEGEQV
jgi:alkylhydroperoxidase/carboxymuconolactone decarboxylase family protein YurZ